MRRMRRVAGNMLRQLQDRHEAHVEALCPGHRDGEGSVRVQRDEACEEPTLISKVYTYHTLGKYRIA